MAITQPGHGRWLDRFLTAAFVLLAAGTVAPAQDQVDARVMRGQSPIDYFHYPQRYSQSVQSDRPSPFTAAPPPWIIVSQGLGAPPQTLRVEPPNMMNQRPSDPGYQATFFGGGPGFVDASTAWGVISSPPIWQPYVGVQGNIGNHRSMGFGQLMMPLYQDGQSLIFADLRGRFDDGSNTEANFGIGVRSMVDSAWILGLYGFYDDKRTVNDNSFQQATFGMEALSIDYEARVNGYIPLSGAQRANKITDAQLIGNTIFVSGGFERAYYGVDGEVGVLLAEQLAGNIELRGFVGGYYYDTEEQGFPVVAGPKGRLELRAYDVPWFGPESRLTFGVELQHDNVRDTQVAGIARLEIPLGFFSGARRLNRLERRMLDRIVRDDDIITVAQKSPREVGKDSLTGRLLNNVILVDKNTTDIPGDVMTAGQAPLMPGQARSTVVVDGKAGVIQSKNIVVQEGQVFRGGGFQVIGKDTGATTTFGTRPTINNNSNQETLMDTVILSNNSTVADLNLTGGLNGISGTDLNKVLVFGNQVSGAAEFGLIFNGQLTNSIVSRNTANNNGFAGIGIENMAAGSTVSGNTANHNSVAGIYIGDMSGGTVSGNNASNNELIGISIVGGMSDGTVSRNTVTGNGGFGIFVEDMPGGVISGNTANNNLFGVAIGGIAAGSTVSGNTANNNFGFGFLFANPNGIGGLISENVANNNAVGGYLFADAIVGTVTGNSATANGFSSNTSANDANANGFSLLFPNLGTFTSNTATGNANNGFSSLGDANPFINAAAGTFSNNTANQNGGQGYLGLNFGTAVNNSGSGNVGGGNTFIFP